MLLSTKTERFGGRQHRSNQSSAKIILSIFIIYSIYTVYYNIYVVGGAGVSVRKCYHSVVGALK